MPVGGIRISREAGTTVRTASYLSPESSTFCRFLSARKVSGSLFAHAIAASVQRPCRGHALQVALTDAGVRTKESERTAYLFLPGGLGTMVSLVWDPAGRQLPDCPFESVPADRVCCRWLQDELFELLTLAQLKKLGR